LYIYKIMDQPKGIIVKYTADKMRAYVSLSANFGPVTAGMVLTELLHKGVVHGLNTAVIHKLVGGSLYDKYVEVAQGTPAMPGADGRMEVLVPGVDGSVEAGAESKPKPLCRFIVVKAGAMIARRVSPVQGVDGMDIFGNAIPAPRVKDAVLRGGSGTARLSSDPDTLVAEYDGVFEQAPNGEITICPYREVAGDASGEISFAGCLRVGGAVRPGASVNVTGSLVVDGGVEGGAVKCGGDLALRAGVSGGNAAIECGGSVQAGGINAAKLSAGGDVTVEADVTDSEVVAGGVVKARRIVGGSVAAAGGISAAQVGAESGPPTVIDIGAVHAYANRRERLLGSIETQNILSEGHISELYCFVRDSMGEAGNIPSDKMPGFEQFMKNLIDSIAVRADLEKALCDIEAKLRGAAGCSMTASEVYPNVLVKLGLSEQRVSSVLKNVLLKPAGVGAK